MGLNLHLLKFAQARVKQADVPPTPMQTPGGMPPAPVPPPTNGAPVPPSPVPGGPPNAAPVGQMAQPSPIVTTSGGAANVPGPVQPAAQRAPGLMQPSGGGQQQ